MPTHDNRYKGYQELDQHIAKLITFFLHQNKNREEVKNREIRYLPDLSIFNLLSVFAFGAENFELIP